MNNSCFYCNNEIEGYLRFASFVQENNHVEKALCEHCYEDWLEGIKD